MTAVHCHPRIQTVERIGPSTYRIGFHSPEIARNVRPGQFVNILASHTTVPLLRRPFSISSRAGDTCRIVFHVLGPGTSALASKTPGEELDCIGPLGNSFAADLSFRTALLVAGGLGVAPMPILSEYLTAAGKSVVTFLGARSRDGLLKHDLTDPILATDDGSEGFHGTIVQRLEERISSGLYPEPRIFACGPTPMLRAITALASERSIHCEVSLETQMACGIGICQGCPVELRNGSKRFALVCREGPVFDASSIILD